MEEFYGEEGCVASCPCSDALLLLLLLLLLVGHHRWRCC